MRAGRGALLKAALLAGSILASLALAEGFVRAFYPHVRDGVVPGRLFEIDRSLGWKLRPGASSVHASRYFRAEYAINDLGFRDGARRLEKGDEVAHRVLLYGDSQAFGWGVPAQRRFTDLVEARLPGLEIWNLSVLGYGLDQELLSYEQSGHRFDADEVLLLVTATTLSRLTYGNIYRKNKPRFELDPAGRARLVPIRGGANALLDLAYETLSVFHLPYFVEQRLAAARRAVLDRRGRGGVPGAAAAVDLSDLELAVLERVRAKALASDHRLTLLVALPPSSEPTKRSLEAFASANGIGYLEIAFPSEEGYVFGPEDRHWNERAHALIADQVAAALESRVGGAASPGAADGG